MVENVFDSDNCNEQWKIEQNGMFHPLYKNQVLCSAIIKNISVDKADIRKVLNCAGMQPNLQALKF